MTEDGKSIASVYREYAAKEESYAIEARIESVRKIHMAAAAKWIELANRADGVR